MAKKDADHDERMKKHAETIETLKREKKKVEQELASLKTSSDQVEHHLQSKRRECDEYRKLNQDARKFVENECANKLSNWEKIAKQAETEIGQNKQEYAENLAKYAEMLNEKQRTNKDLERKLTQCKAQVTENQQTITGITKSNEELQIELKTLTENARLMETWNELSRTYVDELVKEFMDGETK